MAVHVEATLTQLIFDHALRMRMKTGSLKSTAAARDGDGSGISEDTQSGSSESDSGKQVDNLVGRLNNLVTTDLSTMLSGRDFLVVGMFDNHNSTAPPRKRLRIVL